MEEEVLYTRKSANLLQEDVENIGPAVLMIRSIEVLCGKCKALCYNANSEKKLTGVFDKKHTGNIFICPKCEAKYKYSREIFETAIYSNMIEPVKHEKTKSKKNDQNRQKTKKPKRHWLQLSLDNTTIEALKRLKVKNRSRLFERLLREHYPGFKEMVEEITNEKNDGKL